MDGANGWEDPFPSLPGMQCIGPTISPIGRDISLDIHCMYLIRLFTFCLSSVSTSRDGGCRSCASEPFPPQHTHAMPKLGSTGANALAFHASAGAVESAGRKKSGLGAVLGDLVAEASGQFTPEKIAALPAVRSRKTVLPESPNKTPRKTKAVDKEGSGDLPHPSPAGPADGVPGEPIVLDDEKPEENVDSATVEEKAAELPAKRSAEDAGLEKSETTAADEAAPTPAKKRAPPIPKPLKTPKEPKPAPPKRTKPAGQTLADPPSSPATLAPTAATSNAATPSDLSYGQSDALALHALVSDLRKRRIQAVLNDERLYLSYLIPLRNLFARISGSVKMACQGELGTYLVDLIGSDSTLFEDLAELDRIFGGITQGKLSASGGTPRRMEEENELFVHLRVVVEGLREMAEIALGLDESDEDEEENQGADGEEPKEATEGSEETGGKAAGLQVPIPNSNLETAGPMVLD